MTSTDGSSQIGGVFPASLTMFTADGEIDEKGTERHIRYLLRSGAHGIVACGTSGEFISMTPEERLRVITIAVQTVDGAVPVFAGTGHHATGHTIAMSRRAEEIGADGLIVILPYYQKPPKSSIIAHYRRLRGETGLPVMLYNNPGYAGCAELSAREVADLFLEGTIQSVKSTFPAVAPAQDVLCLCGDDLRVFYGSFHSPMEALLGGVHGWISGFLNLLTGRCVELYGACSQGRIAEARRLWGLLLPYKLLYTQEFAGAVSDLAIYRAGLELLGEHGGHSRLPLQPLTADQRECLRRLMDQQDLLS